MHCCVCVLIVLSCLHRFLFFVMGTGAVLGGTEGSLQLVGAGADGDVTSPECNLSRCVQVLG